VDAKYDLAPDDAARLEVLEHSLQLAKLVEQRLEKMHQAGVATEAEFIRARLARLEVEVALLKAKTPASKP
jgi:hypothetical protein